MGHDNIRVTCAPPAAQKAAASASISSTTDHGKTEGTHAAIDTSASERFILIGDEGAGDKVMVRVPSLSVQEFCRKYKVGDEIRGLLENEGFKTAGALLEVSDSDLKDAGFRSGHVAEVKRALKDWLFSQGSTQDGGQPKV